MFRKLIGFIPVRLCTPVGFVAECCSNQTFRIIDPVLVYIVEFSPAVQAFRFCLPGDKRGIQALIIPRIRFSPHFLRQVCLCDLPAQKPVHKLVPYHLLAANHIGHV